MLVAALSGSLDGPLRKVPLPDPKTGTNKEYLMSGSSLFELYTTLDSSARSLWSDAGHVISDGRLAFVCPLNPAFVLFGVLFRLKFSHVFCKYLRWDQFMDELALHCDRYFLELLGPRLSKFCISQSVEDEDYFKVCWDKIDTYIVGFGFLMLWLICIYLKSFLVRWGQAVILPRPPLKFRGKSQKIFLLPMIIMTRH